MQIFDNIKSLETATKISELLRGSFVEQYYIGKTPMYKVIQNEGMQMQVFSIRLPKHLISYIKKTSKKLEMSNGELLRKLIEKPFQTVSVNEYKTSKLCCNCHKENDNKVINSKSLFRLLTCKHCNGGGSENLNNSPLKCSKFLNRDMNSCLNMQCIVKAYLTEKRKRPKEFTRTD